MADYLCPPVAGAPLPISAEKTASTELYCSRGPESVGQSPVRASPGLSPGLSPGQANGVLLRPEHQVRIHLKRLRADPMKDLLTAKVYFPVGSPPPESSKNSEFESGSNKQEDYLARLFGKCLLTPCCQAALECLLRPCCPRRPQITSSSALMEGRCFAWRLDSVL